MSCKDYSDIADLMTEALIEINNMLYRELVFPVFKTTNTGALLNTEFWFLYLHNSYFQYLGLLIIETIDTKNSWGKNQLLKEVEPCIIKEVFTYRSDMDMIRTITIWNALDKFIDYINSKASHGKVELKLALLDLIAKEYEKE